jgi:hypothetical protein
MCNYAVIRGVAGLASKHNLSMCQILLDMVEKWVGSKPTAYFKQITKNWESVNLVAHRITISS